MEQGTMAAVSTKRNWAGIVISAIPVLMMVFSALMKLTKNPQAITGFEHFGYSARVIVPLGIIELTCAVLYAIPRTAVLGAILVTGYLGGAIATQVRIGDPLFVMPLILGILAWLGLYVREPRLRPLVPLRK
jgi:hypothetical protein